MLTTEMTDAQYQERDETEAWVDRVLSEGRHIVREKPFNSARKLIEHIGNSAYLNILGRLSEDDFDALLQGFNQGDRLIKEALCSEYPVTTSLINYIRERRELHSSELLPIYPTIHLNETKLIIQIGEYGFERLVEIFTPEQLKLFVWLYNEGDEEAERVLYPHTLSGTYEELWHEQMKKTTHEENLIAMIIKLNHFNDSDVPRDVAAVYCVDKLGERLYDILMEEYSDDSKEIYTMVIGAIAGDSICQEIIFSFTNEEEEAKLTPLCTWKIPKEELDTFKERAEMKWNSDLIYCGEILGEQEMAKITTMTPVDDLVAMTQGFIYGDAALTSQFLSAITYEPLRTKLSYCSNGELSRLELNNPYHWSYQDKINAIVNYGEDNTAYLITVGKYDIVERVMWKKYNGRIPPLFKITEQDLIDCTLKDGNLTKKQRRKLKKSMRDLDMPKEVQQAYLIDNLNKSAIALEKARKEFAEYSKVELDDVAVGGEAKEVDSNYTSNTDKKSPLVLVGHDDNNQSNYDLTFMNRMHSFRSNITFEKMAATFREMEEMQVPLSMVVYLYHWSETPLSMAELTESHLYCNDNSRDWNTICHPGLHLYQLTCVISRPLFCIEQWDSGEMIAWGSNISRRKLEGRDIDSIIVTPHRWSDEPGLREIKILNAKKSVVEIIELGVSPARAKSKQKVFDVDKILSIIEPGNVVSNFRPTSIGYF